MTDGATSLKLLSCSQPPLAPVVDLVSRQGYFGVEMDSLLQAMEMDEATFRQRFRSLDGCIAEAFFVIWDDFEGKVVGSFEAEGSWRHGLRSASYTAARWLCRYPRETRFAFLETLYAGEQLQAERERRLDVLVDLVDQGRACCTDPPDGGLSRDIAVAVVGGAMGVLVQGLRRGLDPVRPDKFVPQFMYMAVLPYLGEQAAQEELSLPRAGGEAGFSLEPTSVPR